MTSALVYGIIIQRIIIAGYFYGSLQNGQSRHLKSIDDSRFADAFAPEFYQEFIILL